MVRNNFLVAAFRPVVWALALITATCNSASAQTLVGHWKMDEGSGTTASDASGGGHTGTLLNQAGWIAGRVGPWAVTLDGSSPAADYVEVPDHADLDLTTAITIAAWIRPRRVATQSVVTKAVNGVTNGYELTTSTNTGLSPSKVFMRFNQVTSGDTYRVATTSNYPTDGTTWAHVAGTYDGTTMRIYFNGALENSVAGPAAIATNALTLRVGAESGTVRGLLGDVDDVQIYNRALSATEVALLYSCGNGTVNANEQCDDGNTTAGDGCSSTCTVETCFACTGQPSVCTPDNGAVCNDGLFCNGADTCSGGACGIHAGNPCNGPDGDGNCAESCDEAADSCTAADPNGSACNDGLFCNGGDTCSGGACTTHTGDPCAGGPECNNSCNEVADDCAVTSGTPCTADTNACTNDECDGAGACTHPNNSAPCDDGLFCNGTDTCAGGSCGHSGDPCAGGTECNDVCNEATDNCADPSGTPCTADTNVCTNDECDGAGACAHPNNTAPCDDGLFCNGTDTCAGGSCGHAGDPCAGGTECNDACNEAADNCADPSGTPCTADTNACTNDECDGAGACTHPNNSAPCDDGLFCNGTDTCAAGSCGHSGDPCAGGTECNDACNEAADNCADPSGTPCTADTNVCTDDKCNGSGACTHPNNTAPCNDGIACTTVDVCTGGVCVGSTPPECDDGNPCTQDSCDDGTGCVNLEEPATGCFTSERAQLQVRDNVEDTKDQLRWKWQRGEVTAQEDFGTPATTTAYTLCVYDTTTGQSSLATSLQVDPNGAWLSKDPKGWLYKDTALLEDGVQQIKLKPGSVDGKSSAQVKARGVNVPMPVAVGSELFDQDPSVTVQLHNSDGKCWTSEFTTNLMNSPEQFKAKAP